MYETSHLAYAKDNSMQDELQTTKNQIPKLNSENSENSVWCGVAGGAVWIGLESGLDLVCDLDLGMMLGMTLKWGQRT